MNTGREYLDSLEKRAFDLNGALIMSIPGLPTTAIAALALRGEVGGLKNIMFQQQRPGRDGADITISKLRTLDPNQTEGEPVVTYGTVDPRAGRAGSIVRKLSVDEFPQLLSVLKGDMSLVGPRPLPESDIELFEKASSSNFDDWFDFYNSVRPGIFGTSQIMRKKFGVIDSRLRADSMELDLKYAEEASILTDIRILMKAPFQLIRNSK